VPNDIAQLPLFEPADLEIETESEYQPPRPELVRGQAQRLAAQLSSLLKMDVRLAITDNRSTVISYRRRGAVLVLRVHHMFLQAPLHIVDALAAYAGKGDREAGPRLDAFIRAHRDRLKPPRPPGSIRTRGLFYDLEEIFGRLNVLHFENQIDARIGWGRLTSKRGRRSIRMGVYLHDERLIRIHPALDRPEVPPFFIDFVVFHEMLHQAVPADCDGERRQHHGPEFRARERAYPDYERAIAWEKQHLDLLLGTRNGKHRRHRFSAD
jgi:hypothetical protein